MGLNDKEVLELRKKYGSNEITRKKSNTFFKILLESLSDPIIKILLIALSIKIVFLFKNFDWYETLGIVIAIFLASFISSISEYGSNKAFERLFEESSKLSTKVYRNGKLTTISSKEIVINDLLEVASGDKICADGIIKEGSLQVDESFITGESKEVNKKIGDKVYSGSTIYKGSAKIKVTEIGDKTFMGSISSGVQEKTCESPLKTRLRVLAKSISKLGYIGAFLASFAYLFMQIVVKNNFNLELIIETIKNIPLMLNYLFYVLTLTVTIIIVAVPEGLPMMITLVLSSNMKKMLKDNVLVRKLVGIETSGSLNVLLCDKTGTLTMGKLNVKYIIAKNGKCFQNKNELKCYEKYYNILTKSLYLNNESIFDNDKIIGGNTTDRAIKRFTGNMQINDEIINKKLFSSEDKYSMVQTKDYYFYKGACEVLLEKCQKYLSLSGNEEIFISKSFIQSMVNSYTSKGYRVLVNAYGKNKDDLVFINIIVIADTLRPEAKPSLDLIKNAGIKTIMITGDAKETAVSIGKELGLYNDKSIALTHNELSVLTDEQIINLYPNLCIIARALPQDKSRLVSILQSYKLVVGMTGDGVNDCLALKESDCSIAMASGADAAKNVSQFVLLDSKIDNLPLILKEGRRSINNIERSSSLLLSKTIFTIILIIACIFLNTEYFFIPIHLTLITFFTIGVPSFILALEPNHELVTKSLYFVGDGA